MNEQPARAIATLRAGATALLPIYPETFDDVVRLARMAIIGGMIKPLKTGYGDNQQTEDQRSTEARATMIIMQGMELGLPPMQSIQLLAMINGRITAHSEAVPGILLSRGFKIKQRYEGVEFQDDFKAICELTRPDGEVFTSTFSVKDAKNAGLWDDAPMVTKYGKTKPNDSAWFLYKKRMLWARALGFAAKDGGADAMKGLMVREEMEDRMRVEDMVDVTPPRGAATPAVDIPDIPDIPEPPESRPAVVAEAADEPIDDAAGLLEKFRADLDGVKNKKARQQIWDDHEDLILRLSDADQRIAEAIFEGR